MTSGRSRLRTVPVCVMPYRMVSGVRVARGWGKMSPFWQSNHSHKQEPDICMPSLRQTLCCYPSLGLAWASDSRPPLEATALPSLLPCACQGSLCFGDSPSSWIAPPLFPVPTLQLQWTLVPGLLCPSAQVSRSLKALAAPFLSLFLGC